MTVSPTRLSWQYVKSVGLSIVGLMLAFGSWSDTKQLSISLYHSAISNFTHNVELAQLDKLDVGNYLPFAELTFGTPQVIKTSRLIEGVQFRYHKNNKYLLTLIVKNEIIEGYIVESLMMFENLGLPGQFQPPVPFLEAFLGQQPFDKFTFPDNGLWLDTANLVYFIEQHQMGAPGLFLNVFLGYIEHERHHDTSAEMLVKLDQALIYDNMEATETSLSNFRRHQVPNLYAVSKHTGSIVAEALLTKYEFNTYF
ncbi:hypothetical protein GCM10023333_34140 [Ferrimonas pelagia]|uniref:Uncharacterized protein n=2 Tax=Ferrimonas pelagia TaxID=1177826 RepID=A0ABP9FB40_9GAMM